MTEEEAPRKRPRRRRRRSRSRETISAEDGSHEDTVQKAAPEIDPEDIDRLWSSDDEVVTDEVVAKAEPAEPKRITRGEREDGDRRRRGRGRRGSSSSESVKEDKVEKAISTPAEEPESGEYEMVDDLGDENTRKYKNVPTWTEAIGMIVRRRDPSGNPRQRRDSSRGDDRRSGSGQPRRKPRRREE